MIKRILKSSLASLGAVSVIAVAPILLQTSPAKAQAINVDGQLGEYGVGTAPLLTTGVTGSAVEDLQIFLDELGYYSGPIDGTYDEELANVVEEFQSDYGLVADGIVGYNTWNSLIGINPEGVFESEDEYDAATGLYTDYEDGVDYSYNDEGAFTNEVGIFEENEASPENEGVF